ncbi:MAG: hypothetical protein KGZ39_05390 [Simkania sp.]|nr:hypothetical protein [Simkania sp.]
MQKIYAMGKCIFMGILLTIPCYFYAATVSGITPQPVQPITSSTMQGKEWVEKCIEQYPEILWLADVKVRKTEEGQATAQGAYSEQLFGQKFIEFDRTMMTLHCLRLILNGSEKAYQEFTAAQPIESKLSKSSFDALHTQGADLLKSAYCGMSAIEIAQAMETALVLGDMGKSEKAREIFKPYGVVAPDHDDFYGEAIVILQKHPELCPSFARLSSASKALLLEIANIAHYGHVTHLEGGPAMFAKLKQSVASKLSSTALSFDLFVHTCDVAGALGHVNRRSSIVYTETSHRAMRATADACRLLMDSQKTEWDAYNAYLTVRANWLGLDPKLRIDRALARIGAMLRLFTPEDGVLLKRSIGALSSQDHAKIIAQWDIQEGQEQGRTPTYIPAVLVNLSSNAKLGASREERLSQTIALGLPCISKVLEKHLESLENHTADPKIPLNFNKIAGIAKASPELLVRECEIDNEGNVSIPGV